MNIMAGNSLAAFVTAWAAVSAPFVAYGRYRLAKSVCEHPGTKLLLAASAACAVVLSALKSPSVTRSCSRATRPRLGTVLFGPGVKTLGKACTSIPMTGSQKTCQTI